jgi:hypothetical protein
MSSVRLMAPGSIGFAALLFLATLGGPADATAQDEALTSPEGYVLLDNDEDQPQICNATLSFNDTQRDPLTCAPSTATPGQSPSRRAGPRNRPFVTVLMAVPLVTYAGTKGPRRSEILTPADRFAASQLIGVGYVVNPKFRFGVMGIFTEALTGLPPAVDTWQFGGVAPIAIGTFDHFIIGGGPIIGYRSGGQRQSDLGAVVLSGASIPLGKGLALNIATPVTALFKRRVTVSVGVAVGIAKVF